MINQNDLLPEGLEDRLPRDAERLTGAMRAALGAMHAHGYDRVRPPLIEFETSLAERMANVATRRMVRFTDPVSLRTLALRSDMTVQVSRIAATRLAHEPRPLRLCYAGEVATIRADQLDPARQKLQMGAELFGSDSAAAASETVLCALDALEAAGLTDLSIDLTMPDIVDVLAAEAFPLDKKAVAAVRRELDTKDAGGLAAVSGGGPYLPLLYATGDFESSLARLSDIDAGKALSSRIAGLRDVAAAVAGRARITLDPSERHGFEYQTWFGFTVFAEGARAAVGRGGSYVVQGSDEVATGFTLYMDPLLDALPANGSNADPIVYLPVGHDRAHAARLRAQGWRTRAAVGSNEDPRTLGCTHHLRDGDGVSAGEPSAL